MLDHFRRGRTVVLQHVLDEINSAARTIEFVAEQRIGRAGRGAEAAMHAGAQDLFALPRVGIGELREGEMRLHSHTPHLHAAGVQNAGGVEALLDAQADRRERRVLGLEHGDFCAHLVATRRPAWRGRRKAAASREKCRAAVGAGVARRRGSARSGRRPSRKIPPPRRIFRDPAQKRRRALGVGQSRQTQRSPRGAAAGPARCRVQNFALSAPSRREPRPSMPSSASARKAMDGAGPSTRNAVTRAAVTGASRAAADALRRKLHAANSAPAPSRRSRPRRRAREAARCRPSPASA